jgi:hypothetical protein
LSARRFAAARRLVAATIAKARAERYLGTGSIVINDLRKDAR